MSIQSARHLLPGGVVLPDGEIWRLIRCDHIAELVIRGVVQTSDDALISVQAKAFSQAAPLLDFRLLTSVTGKI
jgi:hypothetical protein